MKDLRKFQQYTAKQLKHHNGPVNAARLFYENFSKFLIDDLWFVRNGYDVCVANKDINGNQCTIVWHVDDLKISHANKYVVRSIIDQTSDKYNGIMPLSISRGKVHDYLSMIFGYTK